MSAEPSSADPPPPLNLGHLTVQSPVVMITIRPFVPEDLEGALILWHEAKKQAFSYVEAQQRYTLEESRVFFQETLLPTCDLWIAEEAGVPVGFLAMKPEWVHQLFVRVGWQGRGIGSALLNRAKELAEGDLCLYTFQRNHGARAFYERHGFEAIRFGTSPPPDNEPDVLYRWSRKRREHGLA